MIIFSHRGNSKDFKFENTLEGFKHIANLRINAVEFDVRETKDQELIIIHDGDTKRISNFNFKIKSSIYPDIKKILVKNKYQIPTLKSFFKLAPNFNLINIEIKQKNISKKIKNIVDEYLAENRNFNGEFLITSTMKNEINALKPANKIKLGRIINFFVISRLKKNIGSLSVLVINKKWVNQKIVDFCHLNGLNVYVYTVNKTSEFESLKKLGIDGIYSDLPDFFDYK